MFDLTHGPARCRMPVFVELDQREVGTGDFDPVAQAADGQSSTTTLAGSTEAQQFGRAGAELAGSYR